MAEATRAQLLESVKGFFTSGIYSDLKITCQGEVFNVHKVVVCNRAEFFARAVKFPGKESEDSSVDLPKDEPSVIKLLVQYLYEGDYDPILPSNDAMASPSPAKRSKKNATYSSFASGFPHTCPNSFDWGQVCRRYLCIHHTCSQNCFHNCNNFTCQTCLPPVPVTGSAAQLLVHSQMYEVAEKYRVLGLKDLAKEKFCRSCVCFWDTKEFPIAANHAFSTTPDQDKGLRDIVSQTISNHMQLLEKPEIEALMMRFNSLTFGLLKAKAKAHGWR